MHLPLVGRPIAVQIDHDIPAVGILLRKANPRAYGDRSPDDPVPAVEPLREHVHRASFPVRDALLTAEELADDGLKTSAPHQCEAVRAIGRY